MASVQTKGFRSSRHFGVEFEVDQSGLSKNDLRKIIQGKSTVPVHVTEWEQSISNDYWHVKQDSTCGKEGHLHPDYGWEVASYKASGISDIHHIAEVAKHLGDHGVYVNDNCGFHIHAELLDFDKNMVGVLLARWVKVEPLITLLVAARRLHSKHCKLWYKSKKFDKRRKYTGGELWERCKPTNFGAHHNVQKRVTLNFVNFAQAIHYEERGSHFNRRTVELRLPEGTLVADDIANWVKLFLHFVETARVSPMPDNLMPVKSLEEMLCFLGLSNQESFYILSPELFSLKKWVLEKMSRSENRTLSTRNIKVANAACKALTLMSSTVTEEVKIEAPKKEIVERMVKEAPIYTGLSDGLYWEED